MLQNSVNEGNVDVCLSEGAKEKDEEAGQKRKSSQSNDLQCRGSFKVKDVMRNFVAISDLANVDRRYKIDDIMRYLVVTHELVGRSGSNKMTNCADDAADVEDSRFPTHELVGRSGSNKMTNCADEAADVEDFRLDMSSAIFLHDLKRMKLSSAEASELCSSSSEDMSNNPDSMAHFLIEVTKCVKYVLSKPKLWDGSASFMRDYLRTLLIAESCANRKAFSQKAPGALTLNNLPDDILRQIFSRLNGRDLARVQGVCSKWRFFASQDDLWKRLIVDRWRSLATDEAAWDLLNANVLFKEENSWKEENKWRKVYPIVSKVPQWRCRLQKTNRFICNLVAHQVSGADLGEDGMPKTLSVMRRFNLFHLSQFIAPDAAVLYFEAETDGDKAGFEEFIQYLKGRTRAGLALDSPKCFIFIPPCEYSHKLNYRGSSLLGVVQNAAPPLTTTT